MQERPHRQTLASCLAIFRRVAVLLRPALQDQRIESQVGHWLDSSVIKLSRQNWSDEKPPAGKRNSGIFFSAWAEAKSLQSGRLFYNIHALRLRSLRGHSIQSREFARAFRAQFARVSADWPNVSIDYGPQTLMQGWIALNSQQVEEDVADLVLRFIPLANTIDTLLQQRAMRSAS